jgi:hypothetical protein
MIERTLVTLAFACGISGPVSAQNDTTAEGTVRELYDLVTFDAGVNPNWDRARELFLPEAVVVLRSSRDATTTFTVEGWIQDFVDFIERANVVETGFVEHIIRLHAVEFGDIAHVWVLYEAQVPGRDRPPSEGVDSFQLVRKDGVWKIAAIMNELPMVAGTLPPALREVP